MDESALRFTIAKLGLTYPQIRDRDGLLTELLSGRSLPTVAVLDSEGHVRYWGHDLPDFEDPAFEDLMR